MATIITMPAVVADATEAALHGWLVSIGDTVTTGQPIAEIETEKATVELQAEAAGIVERLLIGPGTSVAVGEPIAVLGEAGESEAAIERAIAVSGTAAHSMTSRPVPQDTEAPTTRRDTREMVNDSVEEEPLTTPDESAKVFSSPLARKLARDFGVGVEVLTGSGPGGRILRRDVESWARQQGIERGGALAAKGSVTGDSESNTPAHRQPALSGDAKFSDVPLSRMRRAIARRLTESKTQVPHFYLSADVEMDALLALRHQLNERLALIGQKATLNDLTLKALGGALADVPAANVTWQGDSIRTYATVDVSVAIATDDGLLTPVVRDVDNLSISSLCHTMSDYKDRVRTGRLREQDLEGGSFSLTNLGMYGTRQFSAILNPPQAGILAVGAAEQRPVVRDGQLAVGVVMRCTLSADHRVIDGAVAAQLLAAFKQRIENPISLLL